MEKNNQPLILGIVVIGAVLIIALVLIFTRNSDETATETTGATNAAANQEDTSTGEVEKPDPASESPEPVSPPGTQLLIDLGFTDCEPPPDYEWIPPSHKYQCEDAAGRVMYVRQYVPGGEYAGFIIGEYVYGSNEPNWRSTTQYFEGLLIENDIEWRREATQLE